MNELHWRGALEIMYLVNFFCQKYQKNCLKLMSRFFSEEIKIEEQMWVKLDILRFEAFYECLRNAVMNICAQIWD